ncbi:hypothetical protein [Methylobacterium sp. 1973]|uniref:hypothetical protein n=1 Tax=Methylobacterium sp. 1973 TaxID=3156421 RepID=UPI00339B1F64
MTRRIDLIPDPRERAALEALWRAQGWPQADIDGLGDRLRDDEALDTGLSKVRAILAALDALPPRPRKAGSLNAADAQALRLDLGADAIAILAWTPGDANVDIAFAAAGNCTAAWRCAPDRAASLTEVLAAAVPSAPPSPASTPETQS